MVFLFAMCGRDPAGVRRHWSLLSCAIRNPARRRLRGICGRDAEFLTPLRQFWQSADRWPSHLTPDVRIDGRLQVPSFDLLCGRQVRSVLFSASDGRVKWNRRVARDLVEQVMGTRRSLDAIAAQSLDMSSLVKVNLHQGLGALPTRNGIGNEMCWRDAMFHVLVRRRWRPERHRPWRRRSRRARYHCSTHRSDCLVWSGDADPPFPPRS
jgi:hypothetical protein